MKKTVIIGATDNPYRYAYSAAEMLNAHGHEFIPVGIRTGKIFGKDILNIREMPPITGVHTVTMYINPVRQKPWYDYILGLSPSRIIFNPGTENPELAKLAEELGIEIKYACTLVLLSSGRF
jgi:predicted CoA-binding protein